MSHEERAQELARAGEQTKEIPLLRTKVAKLDRILGRLPELRRLHAEIDRKRTRVDQLEQEVTQRAEHLEQLRQEASRQSDADYVRNARKAAEDAKHASEAAVRIHDERARELALPRSRQGRFLPCVPRWPSLTGYLDASPSSGDSTPRSTEKRTRVDQLEQEVTQRRKHLDQVGEEAIRQQTSVVAARTELDTIGYDAELDNEIGRVRETATKLTFTRESVQQAKPERERRRRTMDALAVEVDRLTSRVKDREAALYDAQQDFEAAEKVLHTAHRQEAASDLRESLVAGAPCRSARSSWLIHRRPTSTLTSRPPAWGTRTPAPCCGEFKMRRRQCVMHSQWLKASSVPRKKRLPRRMPPRTPSSRSSAN